MATETLCDAHVNVLLVEDNHADARLLQLQLSHAGEAAHVRLTPATRLGDALRLIGEQSFDAVLLDLSLPDSSGMETIDRMGAVTTGIPVIVLTGLDDETTAIESLSRGAQDYLIKGQADARAVTRALRYAIQRKRAERALRENELRLQLALKAGRIGTWELDGSTRQIRCSEYCNMLFDLPPGEGPRPVETYLERIHPEDQARMREVIAGLLEAGGEYYLEFRIARPDGECLWVTARGEVVEATENSAVSLTGSLMDVTHRKQAEDQLYADKAALEEQIAAQTATIGEKAVRVQELASELTQAETQERQRLAQILHDHLQQLLIGARLKLGFVRSLIGQGDLRPRLQHIDALVRESIKVSRSLAVELCPPILYQAGLTAAITWLAQHMEEHYRLKVEIAAGPRAEPASEEVSIVLFQAVRELLCNVAKHARVTSATVELQPLEGNDLQVAVRDAGRGFAPEAVTSRDAPTAGYGLSSIRERVELMGGRMEIASTPGRGSCITLIVPRLPAGLDTRGGTLGDPLAIRTRGSEQRG